MCSKLYLASGLAGEMTRQGRDGSACNAASDQPLEARLNLRGWVRDQER